MRDRDFDFEPEDLAPHVPAQMTVDRSRELVVGWRWLRHCIESYLLEPVLAARALGKQQSHLEELIQQAGHELSNYQAARWTVGQARAKLPPARHLDTAPEDCSFDFRLPPDCSEKASWTWLSTATRTFIEPVTIAFAEETLRRSFDGYRHRLAALNVNGILVWFSGKDILTFISRRLGHESPGKLRNRLRDWVRENPEEAVRLLPEWAELKRVLSE